LRGRRAKRGGRGDPGERRAAAAARDCFRPGQARGSQWRRPVGLL